MVAAMLGMAAPAHACSFISDHMMTRRNAQHMITAMIGVAASTAVLVAVGLLGVSRADDTPEPEPAPPPLTAQDQQFLNLVHANKIPGEDDTLIAYAHEFCAGPGPTPSGPVLIGQGVGLGANAPGIFYVIQTIASRVYCPTRVPVPPAPPLILQTPGPAPGAGLPR